MYQTAELVAQSNISQCKWCSMAVVLAVMVSVILLSLEVGAQSTLDEQATSCGGSSASDEVATMFQTIASNQQQNANEIKQEIRDVRELLAADCDAAPASKQALVSALRRKYRARQLYNNISMLFLFPVKDGKLSTGVNATFNASCYG